MSNNVSIENFPVKIQDLPSIAGIINSDSFIVDRAGEYTGKISFDIIANYIFDYISKTYTYYGENPIGLSANTFYLSPGGVTFDKLSPNVQDAITRKNNPTVITNPGDVGSSLTGTLTTFTDPVTATGQFLIINVNDQFKALRLWDFTQS
jgi:hypothetical protein